MTIENLIKSIGKAVEEAQGAIEQDYVAGYFEKYFTAMGSGETIDKSYSPKMIDIELPSYSEGQPRKVMNAPVATLVNHSHMNLDYVKVNLNINVLDETNDKLLVTSAASNNNDAASESNVGMLELTFKCKEAPEGVARIDTALNSII